MHTHVRSNRGCVRARPKHFPRCPPPSWPQLRRTARGKMLSDLPEAMLNPTALAGALELEVATICLRRSSIHGPSNCGSPGEPGGSPVSATSRDVVETGPALTSGAHWHHTPRANPPGHPSLMPAPALLQSHGGKSRTAPRSLPERSDPEVPDAFPCRITAACSHRLPQRIGGYRAPPGLSV